MASARVRLTRRGRVAVAVLVAGLALLAVGLTAVARAQAASRGAPAAVVKPGMTKVIVQRGQSLWSIARRAEPSADPRTVVRQIMDINALRSVTLHPGQRLWVPRG